MDRLRTISEGWTAEVAALERIRRKDGLQPNSDPPPTPEFRNSDDTAFQLLHLKAKSVKEPSISELFEKYISQKNLEKGSRGFSYERVMRFQFRKHLSPLKDKMISEVSFEDMLRLRNNLRDLGLSAKSVHNILSLITQLQNFAGSQGLDPGDPRLSLSKPKRSEIMTHTRERLSEKELLRLMNFLAKEPPFRANLYYLAMLTGMRRSELANLKWTDVRWEEEQIIIRNPKSGQEYEVIPLIKAAAKVLKNQKQLRHLCTKRSLDADCVFFDSNGNPISKRQTCIDNWNKQIREKAKIPKSFRLLHGLRHHFGSVHAANGTPMPVLKRLMRHSDIKTTMMYIEINQQELQSAAQKIVELLNC